MITSIRICDRWELPIQAGLGGHYRYLDSVSKHNAACFLELVERLQVDSAIEYFGGVGIFSTIIQQTIHPIQHWAFDVDPDCVAQLRTIQGMWAQAGDAHETMGSIPAHLVVCDFPICTLRTVDEWPWSRVVAHRPQYIVVSDTALRRLGLHRALYSRLSSEAVVSYEDYCRVYSKHMWDRYGYSVTRVAHHSAYGYFLLEPGPSGVPLITKVSK